MSILPSFVQANTDINNGGTIFEPILKFAAYLSDACMQCMQNMFVTTDPIEKEENGKKTYEFKYSPAIIFSGDIAGLDIDFITLNGKRFRR